MVRLMTVRGKMIEKRKAFPSAVSAVNLGHLQEGFDDRCYSKW